MLLGLWGKRPNLSQSLWPKAPRCPKFANPLDELAYTGNLSCDTCDLSHRNVRCGDQCISQFAECQCGNETFLPLYTDQHCCLPPGGTCTRDGGVCSQGRTQSMSSPCNTTAGPRCYNSYQHSQYVSIKAHYTCSDTCVHWEEMCQGVSWCEGDHQVCGQDLRCPTRPRYLIEDSQFKRFWHNVTKRHFSSSLVPGHHYCIKVKDIDEKRNDGKFDIIDRSDETQINAAQSPLDLDITPFTPCNVTDEFNAPGPGYYIKGRWECREPFLAPSGAQ